MNTDGEMAGRMARCAVSLEPRMDTFNVLVYSFGVTTNKNSGLNRSGHVLGTWRPVKRLSHTSCAFARRVRTKRLCPTSRPPKPLQEFHRPMLKSRSRIRIGYMYSRKENCEYCTH